MTPPSRRFARAVAAIVVVGAVLRIWVMAAHLPFVHHNDEGRNIIAAAEMVAERRLETTIGSYPALLFNVEALTFAAVDVLGGDGDLPLEGSVPASWRTTNTAAVVAMRAVALAASCATIALAAVLALRISASRIAGVLAAALVALGPLDIALGATVTPDPFAGAFATAALLAAVLLVERPSPRRMAVAGALVGLATAAKYNAAVVALAVVAALAVSRDRPPWRRGASLLAIGCGAALAAFVIASPQAIVDLKNYWIVFRAEQDHYRSGHPGHEGDAVRFYLATWWRMLGPALFAVPAVLLSPRIRRRAAPVLITVVVYVAVIASYEARFDRNMLVISGASAALAAAGVVAIVDVVRRRGAEWSTRRWGAVAAALCVVPALLAVDAVRRAEDDPWTAARRYIEAVVPAGSAIALEYQGPWIDPTTYVIHPRLEATDSTLQWYRDHGVAYLVVTDAVRNRYRDEDRYPEEHRQIDELLAATCVLQRFSGRQVTIEVRRILPAAAADIGASPTGWGCLAE